MRQRRFVLIAGLIVHVYAVIWVKGSLRAMTRATDFPPIPGVIARSSASVFEPVLGSVDCCRTKKPLHGL